MNHSAGDLGPRSKNSDNDAANAMAELIAEPSATDRHRGARRLGGED